MSTDLYALKILEKTDLEVKLRVTVYYPGMDDAPDSENFFLQAFWDEADTRFGGGGPLGDAITVDQICDEDFRLDHAADYIAHVECLAAHNAPSDENPAYDTDDWYQGEVTDNDALTWAEFRVTATDARWLAHLIPGQYWTTTAYSI